MNILLANTTCKIGGVSTFLLSLHDALVARGHRCRLFFFEHGSMESHLPRGCDAHFGTLADCLRLVSHERIDIVHANNVDWPTGLSAVRRIGARLVLTAHKVREPAWAYGWTSRSCDALVAVSAWIKDGLQPFTDVPIQVVHNGIDTERFRRDHRSATSPPIVAWVGRGTAPRKRLDAFAAVAPFLHRAGLRIWVIDQQGPDACAHIPAEMVRTLSTVAERWEGVRFDEMPLVYQEIAASGGCVLSTASMEGLPLSLLEAQACGCVVIAPDVLGTLECVRPEHGGTLYPFGATPEELAALVIARLRDAEEVRERGSQAASYVRANFSLVKMVDEYFTIYESSPPGIATSPQLSWLSPVARWKQYLEQRLGVGYEQYGASRALAATGDWLLAAAAGRESFAIAPTMFVKPRRLAHLVRVHLTSTH
jgi:glycosyltransferase involved in cell wall biosynthesis